MKHSEIRIPNRLMPLDIYHAALRRAGNARDKKILRAKVAFNEASERAWEKYKAASK